jgi:hypothetical protein
MLETTEKPDIFAADDRLKVVFEKAFSRSGLRPGKHGWRSVITWGDSFTDRVSPMLAAWMLKDVTQETIKRFRQEYASAGRCTVFVVFRGDLPSRAVADRVAWLNVKDDERIHFVPGGREDDEAFAERLLIALDRADEDNRILDAWWEGTTFVVVSPTAGGFRKLRVPVEKLPILQQLSKEDRETFEIDEDGTFIYWPSGDIHLGWEQFECAVDETAHLKAKQQTEGFNKAYGAAIEALRKEKGLRQSDIEGLTPRQVGRIESGRCRATLSALRKLAKAHHMSVGEYMEELSQTLQAKERQVGSEDRKRSARNSE